MMKAEGYDIPVDFCFPPILRITVLLLFLSGSGTVFGQYLGIKSDLLSDGLFSPNISVEGLLSPHWSLETGVHYQPFSSGELHRWKHWLGRVEFRRWACTPYSGSYWGFHLLGGQFNVGDVRLPFGFYRGTRSSRYEGWAWGGGLSLGHQWVLSPRWGLEAGLGAGVVFLRYDRYRCGHCGERTVSGGHKIYLGPTRAALSLVYLLK